ncbi:hypothetical protein [Qipengyuania gaetbuli]|uniref:hypothetical protein n=1 Tax=Qipengyuania gaetbuli TaxID=266952 RepID=UPI001CFDD337|nr:hypothetical protein [Qipengyuania gaetbuli]
MQKDNGQVKTAKRIHEHMVGADVAEMVLQVLKGSFAKQQAWKHSQEAAYRFHKAAKTIAEEIEDREVRYCFDEASDQLSPELHENDVWGRAAAAGAQYYLQMLSSHGHAYGHLDRTRAKFIAAVEEALAYNCRGTSSE